MFIVHFSFLQNSDIKESGKKSHSRSLMGNFGKHKVSRTRVSNSHYVSTELIKIGSEVIEIEFLVKDKTVF